MASHFKQDSKTFTHSISHLNDCQMAKVLLKLTFVVKVIHIYYVEQQWIKTNSKSKYKWPKCWKDFVVEGRFIDLVQMVLHIALLLFFCSLYTHKICVFVSFIVNCMLKNELNGKIFIYPKITLRKKFNINEKFSCTYKNN